ncbi:MAG: methyltransferase domain-containing protein [Methanomassiliicoccales archaeon]
MDQNGRAAPETVFSARSKFYVTSALHTDPEVLANVVRMAAPERSMIALDIGTGTGHTAIAMAPHVSKVVALDLTEEMLYEGRKLCAEKGILNVEFRKGDAMGLPFSDGTFDIVTCRRAAHHFSDITKAVGEMGRVLCPGGRLIIDDRSVPEDDEVDEAMNHLDILHDPSHVREYRASEWSKMLGRAGLAVGELTEYRKRVPMSRFTEVVSEETSKEMYDYLYARSPRCKWLLNFEDEDGGVSIDHFFVMMRADKVRKASL